MKWLYFYLVYLTSKLTGGTFGPQIGLIFFFGLATLILFYIYIWRLRVHQKIKSEITTLILNIPHIGKLAFRHGLKNFKPCSEPDGFRGIKWGTKFLAAFPNLEKIKRFKPSSNFTPLLESYLKDEEDLKLGRANLKTIEYGFWDKKFQNVRIQAKEPEDWNGLKEATFEKFGKGFQPSKHVEEYKWRGKKTRAILVRKGETKLGELFILSEESLKEAKAYIKQKAKEGARKGF
jgi:hypothetical protein